MGRGQGVGGRRWTLVRAAPPQRSTRPIIKSEPPALPCSAFLLNTPTSPTHRGRNGTYGADEGSNAAGIESSPHAMLIPIAILFWKRQRKNAS